MLVITLRSTSFTVRRNFADRLSYSAQTTFCNGHPTRGPLARYLPLDFDATEIKQGRSIRCSSTDSRNIRARLDGGLADEGSAENLRRFISEINLSFYFCLITFVPFFFALSDISHFISHAIWELRHPRGGHPRLIK